LRVSNQALTIRAKNYEIVLEPRSVLLVGRYGAKREIEHMNRKTVFIELVDKVMPLETPRIDIVGRNYIGNFEVVYTDLGFEKYLTIITPAEHLYDYAVLTSDELMLYMQAKRKLFYEEEPFDKLVLYIK
ncbi:MAG: hypothetical protein LRS48_03245, partial [Desulfurococcales archaeon]|nr:hypothetical protein [Desulfurococcales archaeon]